MEADTNDVPQMEAIIQE
jgi:hypothetical protein